MASVFNAVRTSRFSASSRTISRFHSAIPRPARCFATVTSHPPHPSTPPNPPSPPPPESSNEASASPSTRSHPSSKSSRHKVLIVGGGAAGQSISHQLLRSNKFSSSDIAIIDPSETHDYQPGWTLVGGGLKDKEDLRRNMKDLIGDEIKWYKESVESFQPEDNHLTTKEGSVISYDQLVVCPGLEINFGGVRGLTDALKDGGRTGVSSIYSYETCSNLYPQITSLTSGKAIFTQPAGVVKCAGAPQKAMWLALDHWKQSNQFKPMNSDSSSKGVEVSFVTGMPTMFSVPKYSEILNGLREERGVKGLFQHNLTSLDSEKKVATFQDLANDKKEVHLDYDLLHVTPPMRPYSFISNSPLADPASGFVDVSQATTQHKKFSNVWSIGDSSSLPTSKTAAAITAEAPVLVGNLLANLEGKKFEEEYDGYTSCPLLTEYGKVLLAEFKYGGVPKETFTPLGLDQSVPRKVFYHLKKDFFPWIYYNSLVKGTWAGPKGFLSAPTTSSPSPSPSNPRAFSTSTRPTLLRSSNGSNNRQFSTSNSTLRNTPSRRPRDPIATDPSAVKMKLENGATFISRSPSTVPSPETTIFQDSYLLSNLNSSSENGNGRLPPALKPSTRIPSSITSLRKDLTAEEISRMQAFREENKQASINEIARQFNCSPAFVSVVTSKGRKGSRETSRRHEVEKSTWGWNKRVSRELRYARREQW